MNKLLAWALIAAAAAITGCSSNAKEARAANPAPCPNIVVLKEASRFLDFDGDAGLENIAYTGEIVNVSAVCRYFADEPIEAEVSVDFAFGKGPKGVENKKSFNYFVAVTRKDAEVIAKSEFAAPVEFSSERPVEVKRVDIDKIKIPRANNNVSGVNFEIIVGFSVTPKQATFNRSGQSLKFPNIK